MKWSALRAFRRFSRASISVLAARKAVRALSFVAVARRVRSNYLWIVLIQSLAYVGKLLVHPVSVPDLATFIARADIGPLPGLVVLGLGATYIVTWAGLAIWITRRDSRRLAERGQSRGASMG